MHIKRISKTTYPQFADHGLRADLTTFSLFLSVVAQIQGLFNKSSA